MTVSLVIDRSALSLTDLTFGRDSDTGFVLAPGLSFGTVTWRKQTSEQSNVPGRAMGDYTRDTSIVAGTVEIYGTDEVDLANKIGEAIEAMTQTASGFTPFTITFNHGAAVYQCTATEPGDVTPGEDGVFDDVAMDNGNFMQMLTFSIVRDPIPLQGPI